MSDINLQEENYGILSNDYKPLRQFIDSLTVDVVNHKVFAVNHSTDTRYNFHNIRFSFNLIASDRVCSGLISEADKDGALSPVHTPSKRNRSKADADPKISITNRHNFDITMLKVFVGNACIQREAIASIKDSVDIGDHEISLIQSLWENTLSERCDRTSYATYDRFKKIFDWFIAKGWISNPSYQPGSSVKQGIPSRFRFTESFYEANPLSPLDAVFNPEIAWSHDDVICHSVYRKHGNKAVEMEGEHVAVGFAKTKAVKTYEEYMQTYGKQPGEAWVSYTKIKRNVPKDRHDETYKRISSQVKQYNRFVNTLNNLSIQSNGVTRRAPNSLLTQECHLFLDNQTNGRMYSDLAMLPREERHTLRYNGESFREIDFKACFAQLILAMNGIQMKGDFYSIEGSESLFERYAENRRGILKMAFQMMLNNENIDTAFMALVKKGNIAGWWNIKSKGSNIDDAAKHYIKQEFVKYSRIILAAYPCMEEWIFKARFYELFFAESEIIRECLSRCVADGIACYPMHDCVGCIESQVEVATGRFVEAFNVVMLRLYGVGNIIPVFGVDTIEE